jgi:hypothetical protein
VFPHLKAQSGRFGVPARAVRPLGFAAVAVAAAVTVAGCKPGSFSTSSGSGSGLGTTASSSSAAQVLTLAAQQAQQMNTFSANVQITATGATNASLFGTMNEVATTPTSPTISMMANAGQLGNVKIILSNGMAYMRSPFFMSTYHKRWIESSMSAMNSNSGLNLGPLLALLEGSSPLVQTQMFPFGSNMRYMGSTHFDGFRMREYGGHIVLADILNKLSSSMQPMVQSWMNAGITMTRFRTWLDPSHMVRKLVLIEVAGNTTFTITLTINSFNQPMHIGMPPTTVVFILPGTGTVTATPTPTMAATATARPTTAMTPTPASTAPATGTTPTATPSGMPTHW